MILEINARPGLNIQIANCAGLLKRLELVEQSREQVRPVEDRVAFSQTHFQSSHPLN
jgi:hypothetical protein